MPISFRVHPGMVIVFPGIPLKNLIGEVTLD